MSDDIRRLLRSDLINNLENQRLADNKSTEIVNKVSVTNPQNNMNKKKKVDVLIDGVVYTLVSSEDESYMQRVAFYINQKISETKKIESARNLDTRQVALLTSINITDDYFKVLEQNKEFEITIENLKSEVDIYKKKYKEINKTNELLKAKIENLKLQVLRAESNKN